MQKDIHLEYQPTHRESQVAAGVSGAVNMRIAEEMKGWESLEIFLKILHRDKTCRIIIIFSFPGSSKTQ